MSQTMVRNLKKLALVMELEVGELASILVMVLESSMSWGRGC